jgi:hypothetical protein
MFNKSNIAQGNPLRILVYKNESCKYCRLENICDILVFAYLHALNSVRIQEIHVIFHMQHCELIIFSDAKILIYSIPLNRPFSLPKPCKYSTK